MLVGMGMSSVSACQSSLVRDLVNGSVHWTAQIYL